MCHWHMSVTFLQRLAIQHSLAEVLLRFGVFPVVSEQPGGMGAGRYYLHVQVVHQVLHSALHSNASANQQIFAPGG